MFAEKKTENKIAKEGCNPCILIILMTPCLAKYTRVLRCVGMIASEESPIPEVVHNLSAASAF